MHTLSLVQSTSLTNPSPVRFHTHDRLVSLISTIGLDLALTIPASLVWSSTTIRNFGGSSESAKHWASRSRFQHFHRLPLLSSFFHSCLCITSFTPMVINERIVLPYYVTKNTSLQHFRFPPTLIPMPDAYSAFIFIAFILLSVHQWKPFSRTSKFP